MWLVELLPLWKGAPLPGKEGSMGGLPPGGVAWPGGVPTPNAGLDAPEGGVEPVLEARCDGWDAARRVSPTPKGTLMRGGAV